MMNRIILIGNGFDLAHGLPTSYSDFIKFYWYSWADFQMENEVPPEYSDGLVSIKRGSKGLCNSLRKPRIDTLDDFVHLLKKDPESNLSFTCALFQMINKLHEESGWVDIENEYYSVLKTTLPFWEGPDKPYSNPGDLNTDLNRIKENLVAFLQGVQDKLIRNEIIKPSIDKIIYEPFCPEDISVQGQETFIRFLKDRWEDAQSGNESARKQVAHNYGIDYFYFRSEIETYKKDYTDLTDHIDRIMRNEADIARYFRLPDQILLLNFNYTKTADLYIPQSSEFTVNHIHGELNNKKNPIIFGYGDEMDEHYKKIANLNDNGFLTNIKSIRYLETDNYRKLLRFIDSAPYQIYIMGHSCGNSDRTLLNTLFEHRNCLSIKPYYHKKADGTDNYIDIIQNISRDFNDMTLMRDRVVNKGYCRPLVEPAP